MKKIIIFLVIFLVFPCAYASAEGTSFEEQFIEQNGDYLNDSMPDEAKDYFNKNGLDINDYSSLDKMSVSNVFSYLMSNIKSSLSRPIRLLGILIAISVLIAIIDNLSTQNCSASVNKVFDIIGVLICITILYTYISQSLELTSRTLMDGSNFMMCFVPVFASIVGAGGGIASAGFYNVTVLMVAEISAQLAATVLLPLMGAYCAMAIVEAINPALSLSGFSNGIKKVLLWIIGLVMTLFVGMITIQSITGGSADSVAIRTGKFVASSFIPVIGGAISDAYTTVRGSIGLLRSGIGTFGIIVLLLTIIPPVITVSVTKISISIGAFISELLGAKKVSLLLKNISSVYSIAISLLLCFSLMLIISTTVVMLVGLNIG